MCLNNCKKIKAKKEGIKCYKFLVARPGSECYSSPYWSKEWHEGETLTAYSDKESFSKDFLYSISGGAFHAFANYEDAFDNAAFYYWAWFFKTVNSHMKVYVCECTIPSDSEYIFIGETGDAKCYASQKLRIDKVIREIMEKDVVKYGEKINKQ